MAKLNLTKSTTVAELRAEFFASFGAQVKVYIGRSVADESATLADAGLTNDGKFECRSSLTVASFIERMVAEYGLKVKVYTCDEWVAVLDGLTLESAGKVKKQAVKKDMEDMIAYQRTESEVEVIPTEEIKKSATYGEYVINIASNNSVTVVKGGTVCDNAKGALREVAALVGFEVAASWNTQQLGSKLVDAINNGVYAPKQKTAEADKGVKVNDKICVDGIAYLVLEENELLICGVTDDCPEELVIPDVVSYGGKKFVVTSMGYEVDWSEDGWVDDDEVESSEEESDNQIDGKNIYEFYENSRLKSITFPDTLSFLGTEAILECENLEKVVIGSGIEKICSGAIDFCPNLKMIEIHRAESDIEFESGGGVAFTNNSPNMKVQYVTAFRTISGLEHIKQIVEMLKNDDVYTSGYSVDKTSIENIFNRTKENTKENILARLTIIDSMYSTQMGRRYYGLDELATVISNFSNLEELASTFVKNPTDASIFKCKIEGKKLLSLIPISRTVSLFNEKYGINKNGEDSGVAISLITKYLYFLTGYKFPIYDSIAMEMFPKLWEYCDLGYAPRIKPTKHSGADDYGEDAISCFVSAINDLVEKLGLKNEPLKYDIVDRILWYVGKICRGNLSLILGQNEYTALASSYKEQTGSDTFEFDINKININKLPFLASNKILKEFFELAKSIKNI